MGNSRKKILKKQKVKKYKTLFKKQKKQYGGNITIQLLLQSKPLPALKNLLEDKDATFYKISYDNYQAFKETHIPSNQIDSILGPSNIPVKLKKEEFETLTNHPPPEPSLFLKINKDDTTNKYDTTEYAGYKIIILPDEKKQYLLMIEKQIYDPNVISPDYKSALVENYGIATLIGTLKMRILFLTGLLEKLSKPQTNNSKKPDIKEEEPLIKFALFKVTNQEYNSLNNKLLVQQPALDVNIDQNIQFRIINYTDLIVEGGTALPEEFEKLFDESHQIDEKKKWYLMTKRRVYIIIIY